MISYTTEMQILIALDYSNVFYTYTLNTPIYFCKENMKECSH